MNASAFADNPEIDSFNVYSGATLLWAAPLVSTGDGVYGLSANNELHALSNGAILTVRVLQLDSDPSIRFAFGVNNPESSAGGPATPYTFSFNTPVTLGAGTYAVSSSLGVTLTKGANSSDNYDGNPIAFTPTASGTGYALQNSINSTNAGVDLINQTLTANSPAGGGGFTQSWSYPLNGNNSKNETLAGASTISSSVGFSLSGSDSASISGSFTVQTVPEPRSVFLGLLCAGLFALIVRRRRTA